MNLLPTHTFDAAPEHGFGRCACHPHPSRRLFSGLLLAGAAAPALAREGVEVGRTSRFAKFVPADQVEAASAQQYQQLKREASAKSALLPASHPQAQRLRYIAERLLPHTAEWNSRARQWQWEVSLLANEQLNAFCMPGGKIAFYTGILVRLKLSDDEVAMIMGHEMAHALREHARERIGKTYATRAGAGLLSSLLGLGNLGDLAASIGSQLLTMKFGREDESEADLVGLELAARAGYDPGAGVTLWQKMAEASKGAPPEFLSTHPSGPTRIKDLQSNIPKVAGLYERATKPDKRFPVATAQG